ncbi:Glyoxalase/Bleomycin resistance protein/Dioxygenase superfamily protein [Asanoa hainanensis]|uniref:Glyoxalase/Bleomycin resistance protein/Dioxygenase superfamily protein n=1 Tax=Asanoa hainanensis TaxID=560556 RepID=A0A239PDI7_9ACTN|nr:Glyoxalase/Bleomycin resistance protein/Dioxygenase superfamily protein [Asanoa hainanensis]
MANGNRRPLAPVRKLFAAVLGTCALFVVLFGIGMQSLAIVALGIALFVLAVGLVLVTAIRGGARAWVAGTAHVHSVSEPPASSVFGRCELQVLVDAPGVAGRLVRMRDPRVPVAKWPDVGASLPIMVAIDDPRHIRILWDEVLTHAEAAAASRDDDLGPLEDDETRWPRPEDDYVPPAPVETIETTTADLTDELSGLRKPTEPVVVHQTPGGPIVVEGTLVDAPPADSPPLARRAARPNPHKTRAERAAREEGSGGTATATAPPPTDVPGQRGAAGPNTERPDDVFDQDASWAEPLFTERRVSRPASAGSGPERDPSDAEAGSGAAEEPGGGRADGSAEARMSSAPIAEADDQPAPAAHPAGGPTRSSDNPAPTARAAGGPSQTDDEPAPAARAAGGPVQTDDEPAPAARAAGGPTQTGDKTAPGAGATGRPSQTDAEPSPAVGVPGGPIPTDDQPATATRAAGGPTPAGDQPATTARAASGAAPAPSERGADSLAEDEPARGAAGDADARAGRGERDADPADDDDAEQLGEGWSAGSRGEQAAALAEQVRAAAAAAFVRSESEEPKAPAQPAAPDDDTPPRKARNGTGGEGEGDMFADLYTAYPSARPGDTGATIHGVGLTFLVRDLGRSVAFYRDMLGFQEIDTGEHNAVLASGDTRMVLREIKDASAVSRRLVHLNLEVGDVMSVYEDLRAKGVRFTYPPRVVNRGVKLELWAAAFKDPDGHGIAITQWRSRETG